MLSPRGSPYYYNWEYRSRWIFTWGQKDEDSLFSFFLVVLGLHCCGLLSSCNSLIAVSTLLIGWFYCWGVWALGHMGFSIWGSQTLGHRLNSCSAWHSCSVAHGNFPNQRSECVSDCVSCIGSPDSLSLRYQKPEYSCFDKLTFRCKR